LGGRGENGRGKGTALDKPLGQRDPGDLAEISARFTPRIPGEIAADDELDRDRPAEMSDCHVGSRTGEEMIRDEVRRVIEKERRGLVQDLALERDGLSQYVIEGRDTIRGYEDERVIRVVGITHLTPITRPEARQVRLDERAIELTCQNVS